MNCRTWRVLGIAALCVAVLMVFGHGAVAVAQDAPDEAALITVIKSDAPWLDKQTACRTLRVKGTVASVPALATLLTDEKLSHMARYALEAMPYPEASQALRDALATTKDLPKTGVIISIGVRRDAEAVAALIPLLKDANADIARATSGALGRIASPDAVKALEGALGDSADALRPAVFEGLLAAGQNLTLDGKGAAAAAVYDGLLDPKWPLYVRTGAFRGLAYAEPDKTPQRLLDALGGDDAVFRDLAAQLVSETSGAEVTKVYAEALAKLPADGQIALLRGLAGRKDAAARPAVVAILAKATDAVKLAAVKALATLGNAEDVAALTALMGSEDADIAKTAHGDLTALLGADVNPAIAAAVPGATPAARAKLLDVLFTRRAEQALPLAAGALSGADTGVRIAGLRVLTTLGEKENIPATLQVLAKASEAGERGAVEKALGAMSARAGEEALPLLLEAMNGATPESRVVLLHVCARVGGPKALEPIVSAIGDADAAISGEAARVLCEWQGLEAAPQILKLAQGEDLTRQVLALRGYVRLAGVESSLDARAAMLGTAMGLAKRPDEKKLVLGGYGALPTLQALEILRPYLDDAEVQNEAALAIVTVSVELAKNADAKPKAAEALKAVVEKAADAGIRDRAQKALTGIQ